MWDSPSEFIYCIIFFPVIPLDKQVVNLFIVFVFKCVFHFLKRL